MRRARIALAALLIASPAHARHHHRHHHFARHHTHARTAAVQGHPQRNRIAATPLPTPIFSDLKLSDLAGLVTKIVGHLANSAGMNADFVHNLQAAFAALPRGSCHIGSGFRSHAEQAAIYHKRPGLAARPGHSNHERGLAADLSCHDGAMAWLHAHAHTYGLTFPMSWEPWHIEPIGATRFASHHHRQHYAHHYRQHYARAG